MKTLTTFVLGWVLLVSTAVAKSPPALVVLHVDAAAPGGNGTGAAPFQNLPEAVTEARTLWMGGVPRIIIQVEPGVYLLTATLTLDVPDLELRGSNLMEVDADGWPTGVLEPGTETKITVASPMSGPLGDVPLIQVGPSTGALTGRGVTIAHVTVDINNTQSGLVGSTISIQRAQGFTVKSSYVTGRAFIGIQSIASSGEITGNYITQVGSGTVISAGNASSPAEVLFGGNRSVNNFFGGVLLNGSGPLPGIFNSLSAVVKGNDLSNNTATPRFSFGLRAFVIRRDPPDPFDQSTGHVAALIVGNRIHDNEFPFSIDAGFPYRTFNQVCDPRTYTGSFDLLIKDNDIWGNRLPSLITFTRNNAAINPRQLNPRLFANSWKYLHGATFIIDDPQGNLAGYWFDHQVADPLDPSADYCGEAGALLGNMLIVNGSVIPPGRNIPLPVP